MKITDASDPLLKVLTEPQQRRDNVSVNGKARGAEQGCVGLMVLTVSSASYSRKKHLHLSVEKCVRQFLQLNESNNVMRFCCSHCLFKLVLKKILQQSAVFLAE